VSISEPVSAAATFTRVCATGEIAPGTAVAALVEGVPVVLVHGGDGNFYAAYDECSHERIALSEGDVDGCTLECWLHGSRFDLRDGRPSGLPATRPIPVYPVEIRDGDLYVSLQPSNGVKP
jgi:3-phenylpropionate/trans-cinnamate dioxygenase ferredoxin component